MVEQSPSISEPVCDLVVLTWNQLKVLKPCIDSILTHTHVPVRLTIVDNGSDAATKAYLESIVGTAHVAVRVVTNAANEGFVRGMNRGLRLSTAPYVCLMNNDLLVTSGWLKEMLSIADAHPDIGVMNPSSNNLGDHPRGNDTIDQHAERLARQHGQFTAVGMCIGFCMLIRRDVIQRIGGFDEGIDRFYFEDKDYSRRAHAAGFQCVVATASYVFHHEHASLKHVTTSEELFKRNQRYYHSKWGRPLRLAVVLWSHSDASQITSRLHEVANQGSFIHVLCQPSESNGQSRPLAHGNITYLRGPSGLFRPWCLWRLIRKRKKPYDIIVTHDAVLSRWCEQARWLHRAEITTTSEGDAYDAAWTRKAYLEER